jgi:hypothetical protein
MYISRATMVALITALVISMIGLLAMSLGSGLPLVTKAYASGEPMGTNYRMQLMQNRKFQIMWNNTASESVTWQGAWLVGYDDKFMWVKKPGGDPEGALISCSTITHINDIQPPLE